ncbi:MAG: DUF475 domain-containing protein [Zoogloeaceae bacterium]|jgi:hypothetical protein|nr:DUF475 domain-containing protein [Zoogloeaceae bacterium]
MTPWHSRFIGAGIFCVIALVLGYFVGGWTAVATVVFLSVLEISLSFDNAVVNAGVLSGWGDKWRRRFLTWGIVIAVFGLRFAFPVAVVAIATGIGPVKAIDLAFNDPAEYGRVLGAAHHQIAAFGGAFLMMVFLSFFVVRHKTDHWLGALERPLSRLGKLESIEAALALFAVLAASWLIADPVRQGEFVVAGIWGVVLFIVVKGLSALIGGEEESVHERAVKQGAAGFLYLELLDASFSFDGVIGAFAMTHDLVIIALGLGVGAMFVRSFTLLLVERGTLDTYRYLEHGAFWAVGALAAIMLWGVEFHIPEAITGFLGALLIVLALGSSIRANRKSAQAS